MSGKLSYIHMIPYDELYDDSIHEQFVNEALHGYESANKLAKENGSDIIKFTCISSEVLQAVVIEFIFEKPSPLAVMFKKREALTKDTFVKALKQEIKKGIGKRTNEDY